MILTSFIVALGLLGASCKDDNSTASGGGEILPDQQVSCEIFTGAKDFTDDSEITYKEAVDVISALGVVDGYSDGDFRPDDVLTRGAFTGVVPISLQPPGEERG